MSGHARAGHAERMADGDATAIDVVALVIDLQSVAVVHALRRKRFVELPEISVVHRHARVLSLRGSGLLKE